MINDYFPTNKNPICPYCKYEDKDWSEDIIGDPIDFEEYDCDNCGKTFVVNCQAFVSWHITTPEACLKQAKINLGDCRDYGSQIQYFKKEIEYYEKMIEGNRGEVYEEIGDTL